MRKPVSQLATFSMFLLLFFVSPDAQAGCWPEWQGYQTRIVCDGAGAKPTFENVKQHLSTMDGVDWECTRALVKFTQTHFGCGMAMAAALKSGGVLWVGAYEECDRNMKNFHVLEGACQPHVEIIDRIGKKKNVVRVCNETGEVRHVAIAKRVYKSGNKRVYGWIDLNPGQCRDYSDHMKNAKVIYAMATTKTKYKYPNWKTLSTMDNATFCTEYYAKMDGLLPEPCHKKLNENLVFRRFGRVPFWKGMGTSTYYYRWIIK